MDRLFSPSKKKAHSRKESGQFYFVPREPGVTSEVRDEDAVVELNTDHANDETYEPKPVNRSLSLMSQKDLHRSSGRPASARTDSFRGSNRPPAPADGTPNPLSRTLFAIFGGYKPTPKKTFDEEGAKKVDPKIYFSLERTFLAWMKAAIWIAAISIAIGSREANSDAQALYSLFFLGVAIVFIVYALAQYAKRSLMVVRRSPGPYEDKRGPMILGSIFALTLTTQFCVFIGYYFFK